MSYILITLILVVVFLILDRLQTLYSLRKKAWQEDLQSRLEVLKVAAKHDYYRIGDPEGWTARFLQLLGYNDISGSLEQDRGYHYSCRNSQGDKVYVSCLLGGRDGFESPLTAQLLRSLVGAMVVDGVTNGLVITAGSVEAEAEGYLKKIPQPYRIEIIDGDGLVQSLYDLRTVKLEPLLQP
ncbi:MAG: restriction endonuclease [Dethiobacteria bacterium]|nr:restriction endonuclease [Bacillota bacterium]HOP69330.1 restriction endonuclease [Bacillota bacterium]HPT34718.1 restriction endonuclease [Bacillota bacterium]HQD06191.1 restriction endonuclease [Bacillota bacterium]